MRKLIASASLMLTAIMFASGYVVVFVTNFAAAILKLPGPYSDAPVAWVWLAVSLVILFVASVMFCGWLVRAVEKRLRVQGVFQ